jgi:predicted MFS family arabinose efflux permease
MVAAFLCFAFSQSIALTVIGFVMLGLTAGANSTLPAAFWAEFYGTRYIGSIKALAAAFMVLGSAIGPGLTGLLIDQGVGLESQFIGIAAFFILTSVLIWIGVRKYTDDL